jgi:hypothetical protein
VEREETWAEKSESNQVVADSLGLLHAGGSFNQPMARPRSLYLSFLFCCTNSECVAAESGAPCAA